MIALQIIFAWLASPLILLPAAYVAYRVRMRLERREVTR